jgi:flagellar biosynthesis protein FlhF
MTVKRFVAATARECLRKVKEELGQDAIVVTNKAVPGGVEIVAMSPDSLEALSTGNGFPSAEKPSRPAAPPAQEPDEADYRVTLSGGRQKAQMVRPWIPTAVEPQAAAALPPVDKPRLRPLPPRQDAGRDVPTAPQVAETLRAAVVDASISSAVAGEPSVQVSQLMDEMKVIKGLLERQLAGFAWGEMAKDSPVKVQLLSELLDAGFAGQSSRRMVQEMPADIALDDGRKWLRAAVNRRLRTLPPEADFVDQGGIYALVGPTGVGKTTTTAKLAARCVVRYGAERLALLTTDGYRIGAHEQLRIYGRILGVPVFVVRDGEDLRRTLADLRDKHMVLIDTVGMSQRDRMVAEQAAMLTRSGRVNRLLLLNAGSRGDTLDDVVRAYAGEDLAGCILTKVDEAASLAPALDCVVRHGLTLAYVANGQRVPEDLHLPNRNYLMHRAFKVAASATAHRLSKEEVPLALPTGATPYQDSVLG